jgi:endonuclease YncB( thermonuclease family)
MRLGLGIVFLAFGLMQVPAAASSAVDGDTLLVGRLQYRLCGIYAPELGRPGSEAAKQYLEDLIGDRPVKCTPVGQGTPCDGRSESQSYGRIVAQCFVDGKDIAEEMVRSGHAKDWPKFSGGHYAR